MSLTPRSLLSSSARLLLLAALLLPAVAGCKSEQLAAVWTDAPRRIDGNTADWDDVSGVYLSEQNAGLAVANDSQYVYVLFRTSDPRWAGTIKRTGLTLYVDVDGGKDKDFFVRFKGGPSRETLRSLMKEDGGRMAPMRGDRGPVDEKSFEEQPPSLTCFVKDRIIEKPIPLDGSEGPAVAFDTCQGFFTYEFRLPLVESSVRRYGIGAAAGQKISIGGEWGDVGGMRPQSGMRGGGGDEGFDGGPGGRGGMGGGPPGGMGGGPGGGMGGERPQMPEKQEVWFKTLLSTPSEASATQP